MLLPLWQRDAVGAPPYLNDGRRRGSIDDPQSISTLDSHIYPTCPDLSAASENRSYITMITPVMKDMENSVTYADCP